MFAGSISRVWSSNVQARLQARLPSASLRWFSLSPDVIAAPVVVPPPAPHLTGVPLPSLAPYETASNARRARKYTPFVWPKKVERVLLVKRPRDEAATEWACRIAGHLSQNYNITTYVEPSAKPDLPNMPSYETLRQRADGDDDESFEYSWQPQIDMVITLGGDGTLLQAAALFRENTPPPPTCSFFSQGAIGFLSPHPPSEHERVFESILENRAIALPRLRIEFCVTTEQEWEAANAKPSKGPHVDRPVLRWNPLVNELVLKRAQRLSGVAEVECYVDGNLLAHFQGDGLLVATPTGSTAYSLGGGGAIVHPEIDAIMLTPLNSMSLSSRPLVLPGRAVIKLKTQQEAIFLEGKFGRAVKLGECIIVRRSPHPLLSFSRINPSCDWVFDLGARLAYERQVIASAQGCPDPHQRKIMHDYTLGRFRASLPPWAKVSQLLQEGQSEIDDMNFYHHVRQLKEQHAAKVNAAPITTRIDRPKLEFDAPIASAARPLTAHPTVQTPPPPNNRTTLHVSAAASSNHESASPVTDDDRSVVEHYLFTLPVSQLDELGIDRAVTRTTINTLLKHHRLGSPAAAAKKAQGADAATLALLAKFLRVHASKA